MTLTSSFFRDVPMIWTKTDEATASSASIVATAMELHNGLSPRFSILSILPLKLCTIYWPAVRVLASFFSALPLKLDLTIEIEPS